MSKLNDTPLEKIKEIDWESLGKALGKALEAAVETIKAVAEYYAPVIEIINDLETPFDCSYMDG